jgi:ABC-type multidrug transport system ATPase subunit
MMSPAPLKQSALRLDVQGLEQKVGSRVLLAGGMGFSIPAGAFVGLLGPSGSGKSTLLKACCGLQKPTKGKILLNGEDFYKNPAPWRSQLGYVPQDDIIHQELTVEKAVDYAARLRLPVDLSPERRKALVSRVIAEVGLQERLKVRIRKLSGGQRKRASVAVELLSRPGLLFLDEPTSGQDPKLEEDMMRLFRGLSREGATVVVTTHAMASIELLDTVLLLQGGWLVYMGPPTELLAFFDSRSYEGIFRILAKDNPVQWAQRFRSSKYASHLRGF